MVSGLNTIVEAADRNRDLVAVSVPIALAQLVLLSWFMLYLVVAHTTDELGPEIGLAKLRGFRAGDTATTGLAESLVLVLAAVPVGFLAGLGVTELVARSLLADGVHVEIRQPVVAVCLLALVGGVGAASSRPDGPSPGRSPNCSGGCRRGSTAGPQPLPKASWSRSRWPRLSSSSPSAAAVSVRRWYWRYRRCSRSWSAWP